MIKYFLSFLLLFKKIKITAAIIILMALLSFKVAYAEEHGAPESKGEAAEAEKGEKEEGKEGAGKEGAGSFIKKDEYLELNSSIEQMSAKIRSRSEDLKKLLLEREKVKESTAFKDTVKQIEAAYREIKDLTENIEKKKTILKHRFPERSFVKSNEKSKFQKIEEIGADATLDNQVDQLLTIVESQYKMPIRKKQLHQRQPASHHSAGGEAVPGESSDSNAEQNPNDFSQSLILKK